MGCLVHEDGEADVDRPHEHEDDEDHPPAVQLGGGGDEHGHPSPERRHAQGVPHPGDLSQRLTQIGSQHPVRLQALRREHVGQG